MKLKGLLLIPVVLSVLFSTLPGPTANAQRPREFRMTAYPVRAYLLKKGLADRAFPDYVVEFDTEQDSRAHLVKSSDGHANEVLRASSVTASEVKNGKLIVRVVAGFRARQLHSYGGSVQDFARTLRVEYLTRRGPRG